MPSLSPSKASAPHRSAKDDEGWRTTGFDRKLPLTLSSSRRTRGHRCYNSALPDLQVIVSKVENAHERAMERCVNLAAPLAGMEDNLADESADIA